MSNVDSETTDRKPEATTIPVAHPCDCNASVLWETLLPGLLTARGHLAAHGSSDPELQAVERALDDAIVQACLLLTEGALDSSKGGER